ncbi:hypothetical protein PHMEG_00025144 [Phytophthora megakarya]|uniref:Reverse transcriptase RNase H-like domain-containing protein n=1 Tax=Phytophthora megakarya TaxID=4795 RepID=A0A225VCD7_9STRA|nr:hypothetical protein PHMEG_00025144 [Phytophthora megakarya]
MHPEAEMNYHPAQKEVLALLLLLKTCYTQLADRTIHVYTRISTLEWVHTSTSLFRRTTQFAEMLSPWHLVANRVKEKDCAFAQLLLARLTNLFLFGGLVGDGYTTHEGIFYRPDGPSVVYLDPIVGSCSRLMAQPKPKTTMAMVAAHGLCGDYRAGL